MSKHTNKLRKKYNSNTKKKHSNRKNKRKTKIIIEFIYIVNVHEELRPALQYSPLHFLHRPHFRVSLLIQNCYQKITGRTKRRKIK